MLQALRASYETVAAPLESDAPRRGCSASEALSRRGVVAPHLAMFSCHRSSQERS